MTAPASSPAARAAFDEVHEDLAGAGLHVAQMMGRPMLAVGRQMVACLEGDALGVRLGAGTPEHTEALALPGAELFTPGERGRVFRDWVALPLEHADRWTDLTAVALQRLRSGGAAPR